MFHERQMRRQCGLHCVNNMLQRQAYDKAAFHAIGLELQRAQEAFHSSCCLSLPGLRQLSRFCRASVGDYDVQVIEVALARCGLELRWFDRRQALDLLQLGEADLVGLILNLFSDGKAVCPKAIISHRHWLSIRRWQGHAWVNFDSRRLQPKVYDSEDELLAWLEKALSDSRSCIFRVLPRPEVQGSSSPGGCETQEILGQDAPAVVVKVGGDV